MKMPTSSLAVFCLLVLHSAKAQVNVTTYHNDNARTGQNTQETVLTTSNVVFSKFGKIFSVNVDGQVYAQPLVLSNVSIGGGTHNVVYVATENDSVYALDADSGSQYWHVSLGTPEPWADTNPGGSQGSGCNNIMPSYGITSTPVIDPSHSPPLIYVVAENGAEYQLHALAAGTGAEQLGGPVTISGSYAGISFDPLFQLIRPGLLLENGHVIIAAGSHCDSGPWFGWVFSYSASTLKQEAILNLEPSGHCAGVWMSGGGVAADSSGNLYLATGNGDFGPNFTSPANFGDSILKLSPPASGTFSIADWFTPHNQDDLSSGDTDLGSGGVLLLPDQPTGDTHHHLLAQMGKEGVLNLVDRDNMGKYCTNCIDDGDTNIVQEIIGASVGVWGSPAYWNNNVYFGSADDHSNNGPVKEFSLYSTTPLLKLTSQTSESFGYSTPTPSVSSNGTSNGIVWLLDNGTWPNCCAVLHAYDASNLGTELYNSSQVSTRDEAGYAVKFTVPTIANGKVYVGGGAYQNSGQLTAYGEVPPSAVLSPTSWTVEGTPTSPPQHGTFTLTNASPSTLTITSIQTKAISGPNYFGISGDTCGSSLATLASCTITVVFAPSVAGNFYGQLVVTDSVPNSPQTAFLFAKILPLQLPPSQFGWLPHPCRAFCDRVGPGPILPQKTREGWGNRAVSPDAE